MIPLREVENEEPELYPSNSQRRMNEEELQFFRNEVDERNQGRLKKKHIKELSKIDREVFAPIPKIIKLSRSLSQKRNIKKHLSQDVFERLGQDKVDREKRKMELLTKTVIDEGGFRPVINDNSKILVERSKSKKSFRDTHQSERHKKCK